MPLLFGGDRVAGSGRYLMASKKPCGCGKKGCTDIPELTAKELKKAKPISRWLPYDQLTHPMNMKGISSKQSLYSKLKEKVAEQIPYSVSFWYRDCEILHPIRQWENFLHVVKWVPILWRDRDWDNAYLYQIMAFKLKNMRQNHLENRVIGDWKKVASEIKIAEDALNRIIKDEYCKKEYNAHYRKYPSKWLTRDKWEKTADGSIIQPRSPPEESKSFLHIADLEEANRHSDFELFCDMFTNYSRGWWD